MKKRKPSMTKTQFQQVCLLTQICFVRNLAGEKFPNALTAEERVRLGERIATTLCEKCNFEDITHEPEFKGIVNVYLHLLPEEDREPGYHLLRLGDDLFCEVMATNHLTFTCRTTESHLMPVACQTNSVIESVGKVLPYAYHERYGYLTAQLPLLGTGFRVRSMLHLAGLSHFNHLRELCNAAEFSGALVELDNPEPPPGHQIILFNRFSLGRSVMEILMAYCETLEEVITHEWAARQRLLRDEPFVLYDLVSRCQAIAAMAHLVSENEALDILSDIRLAASLKIFSPGLGKEPFHPRWFVYPTNAFLTSIVDEKPHLLTQLPPQVAEFTPWRLDAFRADYLRHFATFELKDTFVKRALNQ